jgi:Ca2+-binding RTX toxin-like protein
MVALFGHGTGYVGLPRDMDWFRIEVQAGQSYTLSLNATSGGLDPYVRLYDAYGRLIGGDDDSGPGNNAQISFVANATTHMFVSAAGYGSTMGGYDVGYAPRGVSRTGGFGADSLVGGSGADTIFGGAGSDTLRGYGFDDVISGDAGRDFLSGGTGRDTVDGGTGSDTLYGGSGADSFVFQQGDGSDSIRDFQNGLDRISVQGAGGYGNLWFISASNGTWVDYGNGSVFVQGATRAQLDASDFLFA